MHGISSCHDCIADTSDFLKHIAPINTEHRQAHKYRSFGGCYTLTDHLAATHTHTHKWRNKDRETKRENIDGRDRERENKYPNPEQKILLKSC